MTSSNPADNAAVPDEAVPANQPAGVPANALDPAAPVVVPAVPVPANDPADAPAPAVHAAEAEGEHNDTGQGGTAEHPVREADANTVAVPPSSAPADNKVVTPVSTDAGHMAVIGTGQTIDSLILDAYTEAIVQRARERLGERFDREPDTAGRAIDEERAAIADAVFQENLRRGLQQQRNVSVVGSIVFIPDDPYNIPQQGND